MSLTLLRLIVVALLGGNGVPRAFALPADTLRPGRVADTVHAASDSTQTYALYLPSRYDRSRRWPVLFLMDPRGRALLPLELFRSAAELYGYIVMSSYQTQSDGPVAPNDRAVNAMLADAQTRFSIDTLRLYFAGFSGTGRLAWYYSYEIPSNVAGLIEAGAGLPEPELLLRRTLGNKHTPFAVFLSAGSTDFNYEEVVGLDSRLEGFGIRHQLETFSGGHSWPPDSVCADALTWMQLQAMADGRLATDRRWIDSLFTNALGRATRVTGTSPYAASILLKQMESDFAGLHSTAGLEESVRRLSESESVKLVVKRIAELTAEDQAFHLREDSFFTEFAKGSERTAVQSLRKELGLDQLRKRAEQITDTLDAAAAIRLLSSVFVRASYYEPLRYLTVGDTLRALRMYELAQSIHPEDAQLCAQRDRVYRAFATARQVPQELACASAAKGGAPVR
jgi:predicted esterase